MKNYYYVNGQMGMTSSGSFTKDRTRWIMFNQIDKEFFEETNAKPYGATKCGKFVEVK